MSNRVLIAIGDGQERWAMREHLLALGFEVFATGNAGTAIHWLEQSPIEYVIADCLLPGTGIAIPHVVKRRAVCRTARTIGIVRAPLEPCDRLRELLGYDELILPGLPVVRVTKRLVSLSS